MYYRAVGEFPKTRHTVFTTADGRPTFEEFIGEEGFSGTASHLYHLGVPANLVDTRTWEIGDLSTRPNVPLRPRHFRLPDLFPAGAERGKDVVRHRRLILANDDVRISYVVADTPSPLYSNGLGDEVVYIESGEADVESVFGTLSVGQGDNVVIPRVAIHRWIPKNVDTAGPLKAYCVEGNGHIEIPAKYLTRFGQFIEGAPLTERDIRGPVGPLLAAADEADQDTEVYVKHGHGSEVHGSIVVYDHHPFDVVGWDGYLYPYAFNYRDFSPVTGKIIQPPPTYQILEGPNFVVCNFVPRMLEYGEGAITVPYYHSNVDADEVMFYYAGETAARKGTGIGNASVSLHPAAYTHGPTREAYLNSVGATESKEMAFMVDTFNSLRLGEGALACDVDDYPWTWAGRRA
ncbi:homogentisate 1,2-dioxygenase [Mycolicibacterium thermoresistibile]|uniref:Homogentisate 1,2-dioxygenase n=2 Tax=Mycolicibacterium thermoresistibile TaxID=1797 RepID=G7CGK6_MYCT3|nr:homogentisate 1,2-dioxygenase [Mycolicibacterium thermoresistibile]EHI11966.1 homogentisate 1,2-dioxygenase [Mycolicibacterium thermoresistibile ATCC 19527]MCV7188957.1 homogentisate 1,2-dioxygenase [Mycolicibacterium thermoresistibile]GAT14858.1 homogentisate 1,2-dioxygenase [Mycolicibacterium thermoresistibile]SNW20081.1 Putative homogentisate 1,2-dioxygenase [Mycolicibacterium thermoresistibile]